MSLRKRWKTGRTGPEPGSGAVGELTRRESGDQDASLGRRAEAAAPGRGGGRSPPGAEPEGQVRGERALDANSPVATASTQQSVNIY